MSFTNVNENSKIVNKNTSQSIFSHYLASQAERYHSAHSSHRPRRLPLILLVGEVSPFPSYSSFSMIVAHSFRTLFHHRHKEKDWSRHHKSPWYLLRFILSAGISSHIFSYLLLLLFPFSYFEVNLRYCRCCLPCDDIIIHFSLIERYSAYTAFFSFITSACFSHRWRRRYWVWNGTGA